MGQNSTEDWFKKPSVSQSLESSGTYGKFTRSTSYVIPYAETPDSLKAVVREKAREFIHIEEDEPLQSVASNLCAYFDALYANSTLAQASPVATSKVITEVMDIYHSLDVNSKIKFLDHVRSFSQSHSGLQNISDEQNDNVLASIDVAQASNDNIPPSDDDANPCSDVLPVNKAPPGCSDDGNTTTAVKENKANEAAPPPKRKRQCRGAKRRKKD